MNRIATLGVIAALALVGSGCVNRAAQAQAARTNEIVNDPIRPVRVTSAETTTLFDQTEITGEVTTSDDVQVGAKIGGRISAVFVKDGDQVAAGQLIASMDTATLSAQVMQAQSQVSSAQSALAQALSNARISPERTRAAVRSAEASVRSARAQLEKAQKGARPEERAQAEWAVRSAKTNLETARKELDRVAKLVSEGAIESKRLETAQNQFSNAQSQYESAVQSLALLQNGTRSEDLSTAREAVRQAEENLRSAKASKDLDVLLTQQVSAARAQVASAQAQLAIAQENLADASIRAPFSGRVSGKPVQPGTVVGAGSPILRLIGGESVYYEGEVSEEAVARLAPGKPVEVSVTALPDRKLSGEITAISPSAENVGRLFKVRISIVGDTTGLKPGMFARGKVTLQAIANATVLPSSAVISAAGIRYVMVKEGDVAKQVKVTTGISLGDKIQVLGLPAGSQVIIQGQENLVDGAKVRIEADAAPRQASAPGGSEG